MESKHPYLRMIGETFHELPGWQKFICVFAIIAASPALAILATLMVFALFPLVLVGRFEGDMGPSPLAHDISSGLRHQHARTHHYYAT